MQENKMRTFQRLFAAFVLTLTLALAAFAGEIQTTVASQQPSTSQATTQGEISTTVTATSTEIVLNLILGVFSLI
jgi:hypothetical protein